MDANTIQKPFIVTVDGEVDPELSILPRERTPITALQDRMARIRVETKLQAEMALYDAVHGTHYRRIRNKLQHERRNQAFEQKIGISRI